MRQKVGSYRLFIFLNFSISQSATEQLPAAGRPPALWLPRSLQRKLVAVLLNPRRISVHIHHSFRHLRRLRLAHLHRLAVRRQAECWPEYSRVQGRQGILRKSGCTFGTRLCLVPGCARHDHRRFWLPDDLPQAILLVFAWIQLSVLRVRHSVGYARSGLVLRDFKACCRHQQLALAKPQVYPH